MELIKDISHYFLFTLAFGTQFFYFLVNSSMTGAGFIRLLHGVSLGCVVASMIVFSLEGVNFSIHFGLYGLIIILHCLIYLTHRDQRSLISWLCFGLLNLSYLILGVLFFSSSNQVSTLYFIITTLFLGITNYAMILGHYYLVVPKLSEKPLLVSMQLFWVFLAFKVLLSSYALYQGWEYFSEGSRLGSGFLFNWIIASMRFLWGYLALGILSIFGYKLAKMRSIQSATGIYYVMDFFVFVGELTSAYFYFQNGLAL